MPKGKWLCDACANPPPTDAVSASPQVHPVNLDTSQTKKTAAQNKVVSTVAKNRQQQRNKKKKKKTTQIVKRKDLVCCVCQGGTSMTGTEYTPAFRYIPPASNESSSPRWIHLACAIWSLPDTLSSLGLVMDWTSLTLSAKKPPRDQIITKLELKSHERTQSDRQTTDQQKESCYLCTDQGSISNVTKSSAGIPQEALKPLLLHCMHPGGCNKSFHALCGLTYPLEMPVQLEWSSHFPKNQGIIAPQMEKQKLAKDDTSSCTSGKASLFGTTQLASSVDTISSSDNEPIRRVLSAQWLCEEHTTSSYDGHKRFVDGKAEVKVSLYLQQKIVYPIIAHQMYWLFSHNKLLFYFIRLNAV